MSPDELQQMLDFIPFTPMRLTMASGDVVDLRRREGLSVNGMSLVIENTDLTGQPRLRLVSVPNICLLQPLRLSGPGGRLAEEGDS